eukprot:TRINITY_DN1797_c0_g1_i1.p1 TRINITY_DN1797_c0_g1~~TRINITY_DN1797_c0_g1_i1.p1  ORF type:complete len:418 (+),score=138.85 TRINITY_DN1797_c0_g1_i1:44-1297(+)
MIFSLFSLDKSVIAALMIPMVPLLFVGYRHFFGNFTTELHSSRRVEEALRRGDVPTELERESFPAFLLGGSGAQTDLADLLLRKPFRPHPLAINGHLQTLLASEMRNSPDVPFDRLKVPLSDGEAAIVDQVKCQGDPLPDDTPLVVMLHGLAGSSESNYIRHFISYVQKRAGDRRFRLLVLHARGAAKNDVLSKPLFYNAAFTRDLIEVSEILRDQYPSATKFLVTFSMGSNIATHTLAEQGENTPFDACCAVCNPYNMHMISNNMQRLPGLLYSKALVKGLHQFLRRNESVLDGAVDLKKGLETTTVHEFDKAVVVPLHNYTDVDAYYTAASSHDKAHRVTIPYLAFGAADDPISPVDAQPRSECADNTLFATTCSGGHVAHLEMKSFRAESYIDKVCYSFLEAVLEWQEFQRKSQ